MESDQLKLFRDIKDQVDCHHQYTDIASGVPSLRTVIFTIITLVFTLLIEIFAHYNFGAAGVDSRKNGGNNTSNNGGSTLTPSALQPQPEPTPQPRPQAQAFTTTSTTAHAFSTSRIAASTTQRFPPSCCMPDPTPGVRASRLTAAIILYAPIAVSFYFRLAEAKVPEVRYICFQYLADTIYPNWWAITFLNIIPFISATFAFLRTIVDCWLVRYGKTLGYGGENRCIWVPCMPAGIMLGIGLAIWFVVKLGVSWCMGRPDLTFGERGRTRSRKREEDVEMQMAEEERRLVGDSDDDGDEEDDDLGRERERDGPPAYDEAVYDEEEEAASNSKGQ